MCIAMMMGGASSRRSLGASNYVNYTAAEKANSVAAISMQR